MFSERKRPENLPDFDKPPLDEVVIGVQFQPPREYLSLKAKDVAELFKDEFPHIQELPPIEPSYETFGGNEPRSKQSVQVQIGNTPYRSRFWFITNSQNHLIQFQEDRFLLNWRNCLDGGYPRFEKIIASFETNFSSLFNAYKDWFDEEILVNQAEVTYINHFPVEDYSELSDWVSTFNSNIEIEGIIQSFTEVVRNDDGAPCARLIYEINSVFNTAKKRKGINFILTYRGRPNSGDISSVIDFLFMGREKIVERFTQITTENAHKYWERKQ